MAWSSAGTEMTTQVRRYSQNLCCQLVPTAYLKTTDANGKEIITALGWRREVVNLNTVETITEWRGMTESAAKTKAQTIGSSVTMTGSGSAAYESASVSAEARMANPANGWTVVKTERTSSISVSS